jgi:protein arginine kinase
LKQLQFNLSRWMQGGGPDSDIIISSRVRIARNLKENIFPCLASDPEIEAAMNKINSVASEMAEFKCFNYWPMDTLCDLEKKALVEKHLISPMLAGNSKHGALYLRDDETISIMVNEEDHLRIQAILPGLQLNEAWVEASRYDDLFERKLDYAFDDHYGYLTACPTNIGTGLRASVMLHLPAMIISGQINRLLGTLSQVGLAVRGLYGEGTEIIGNLVQVSNQVTLGQSEDEIISNLHGIIRQVVEQEQNARQAMLDKQRANIADKSWRALGLLKYAQVMSSQEAIQLISDLRLGYDLGLIKSVNHRLLNELLVLIRPACLQLLSGRELNENERDLERPVRIKKVLNRQGDTDFTEA